MLLLMSSCVDVVGELDEYTVTDTGVPLLEENTLPRRGDIAVAVADADALIDDDDDDNDET